MPPLNLVGDFGGGSLYFALGIVAALYERTQSGRGQVIDAAIVDGVASLMAIFQGLAVTDSSTPTERGRHFLGGASPYYRCYVCADGKEIAVGALEPQFYEELLTRAGAPDELRRHQRDEQMWGERSDVLARLLLHGKEPVTDVALATGFATPSHFATAFARRFGVPPSRYRAGAR